MMHFFVPGTPKPAGSKNAFQHPTTKRIIVTDSSGKKGKDWRASIQHFCVEAMRNAEVPMIDKGVPLKLFLTFSFLRPKNHFGTGKNLNKLKASAPKHHTKAPDTTKLVRAVEDALNRVLFYDDSQIAAQTANKEYAEYEGVLIMLSEIKEENES